MLLQQVQQVKQLLAPLIQDGWPIQFDYASTSIVSRGGDVSTDHPIRVIGRISQAADGKRYGKIGLNGEPVETIPSYAYLPDWAADFMKAARVELQERQRV